MLNTGEAYGRLKQKLVDSDVTNMMNNDPYCNPNYNHDILHNQLIKLQNLTPVIQSGKIW